MNKSITLTPSQQHIFDDIISFIKNDCDRVFILSGYAGTGKTTVVRFIIEELNRMHLSFQLLASTGRAAKILSDVTGVEARTIHSLIYKCTGFNEDIEQEIGVESSGQLYLIFKSTVVSDNVGNIIYIIDESSMISDTLEKDITQALFGDGMLLKDLLNYDSRSGTKFIFVGDPCQLPPVSETLSPALNADYIRSKYTIGVKSESLTQIMRQDDTNSLIASSMKIRQFWVSAPTDKCTYGFNVVWGSLPFKNSRNIIKYDRFEDMLESYLTIIREKGYSAATFLTNTNKKCGALSRRIRTLLGHTSHGVQTGDLLLVVQNNLVSGVRNGDMIIVTKVSPRQIIKAGLTFREISYQELDSDKYHTQLFMEDILNTDSTNLTKVQQTALFRDFILRMKEHKIKYHSDEFFKAMKTDEYLNALRCCFGYTITCHKSQGGEWPDVYLDMSRGMMRNPDKATYQWIYTAMTRAKTKLHLVNDFYIR